MRIDSPVTAVAFWLGILLPVVYLPVILAGLDSLSRFLLFVGLLVLNVVALLLGRDYPETRSRPGSSVRRGADDSTDPR